MLPRLLSRTRLRSGAILQGVCSAIAGPAAAFDLAAADPAPSIRAYHVAPLASRGVISVFGDDCVRFMQGMTTNDITPLEKPGAGPIYTVLLTAKGKYLHDLFAYSVPGEASQLLLDVDAAGLSSALQWLNKYKLRRKIQLADVSGQYSVWVAFQGDLSAAATGQWQQDPRLPQLGLRGLFNKQQLPPPPGGSGGSSSSSAGRKQQATAMSVVGEDLFRRYRYQLGAAEGDVEIPTGVVAPLECNLDALNGISYTKGCYIGQERNSFTHYRGIVRRRMMPVTLPGLEPSERLPCPVPIVAADGATKSQGGVGMLTKHVGDAGIAYVRLAPALAAAEGEGAPLHLQLEGNRMQAVVPHRPDWWPNEWGREESRQQGQ